MCDKQQVYDDKRRTEGGEGSTASWELAVKKASGKQKVTRTAAAEAAAEAPKGC